MRMQVALVGGHAAHPDARGASGIALVIDRRTVAGAHEQPSAGDFVTFLTAALLLLPPLRHLAALNGPLARMAGSRRQRIRA